VVGEGLGVVTGHVLTSASGLWTLQVANVHKLGSAPYRVIAVINPCPPVTGDLLSRLVAHLKCHVAEGILLFKCGSAVASLVDFSLRDLTLVKTANDLGVLRRLPASLRPLGSLFFHLYHSPILRHAPPGFRSASQLRDRVREARTASGLVDLLPNLVRAIGERNVKEVGLDIALIAGLQPCGEVAINALD
jgi:hypothetical protein